MKIKIVVFVLMVLPVFVFGQNCEVTFARDTSFNIRSAGQKIEKDFPDAVAVTEFEIETINEERDVVYYSVGKRHLHADLFFPRNNENKSPAVILIHGGGWASGNKSHLVPMTQKLAENGFFAASVEHRLSPEAKYPAAITDLKTFVKWVKINAPKYNIDTTKIAVLGCSSGATLASLLAVTGQINKFQSHKIKGQVSDKVQALVNIDGIVDFTNPNESAKDDNPDKPSAGARWLGYTFKQNSDIWIEASPLTYVSENTPPTLYINSTLPRFHAGRDKFLEVLTQNGIYSEIHTIENTPHPFWLFHPWFDETWPLVSAFLNSVFN